MCLKLSVMFPSTLSQESDVVVTHELYGGLGNQLFQIFATMALSLKYHADFFFTRTKKTEYEIVPRPHYWDNLLRKLTQSGRVQSTTTVTLGGGSVERPITRIHERDHSYHPILLPVDNPPMCVVLEGYFQSFKYFDQEFETIVDMLGLRDRQAELCDKLALNDATFYSPLRISMHFRWGDYKHLQHVHNILPPAYYQESLAWILAREEFDGLVEPRGIPVVIVCESCDLPDIYTTYVHDLESMFPQCDFIVSAAALHDWEQMLYMSWCPYNIIANSTFSLWAAYLNVHKEDTVVYYPSKWFADGVHHPTADMFYPAWQKIHI